MIHQLPASLCEMFLNEVFEGNTADQFEGTLTECDEGTLEWVEKERLMSLNLWEGDKIFLRLLMEGAPFFSLKLSYDGDELIEVVLNGTTMEVPRNNG